MYVISFGAPNISSAKLRGMTRRERSSATRVHARDENENRRKEGGEAHDTILMSRRSVTILSGEKLSEAFHFFERS